MVDTAFLYNVALWGSLIIASLVVFFLIQFQSLNYQLYIIKDKLAHVSYKLDDLYYFAHKANRKALGLDGAYEIYQRGMYRKKFNQYLEECLTVKKFDKVEYDKIPRETEAEARQEFTRATIKARTKDNGEFLAYGDEAAYIKAYMEAWVDDWLRNDDWHRKNKDK